MSNKTKKAVFTLNDFIVEKFSYVYSPTSEEVGLEFNPSGKFVAKDNSFELTIDFNAFDEKSNDILISAELTGFFSFENVTCLEEIPEYFYKNAIAILYPYLRSFISTLTLQANNKLMVLPTMNLSSLEGKLKDKTVTSD